jgi:PqqD family protein of HPr-rel-A system
MGRIYDAGEGDVVYFDSNSGDTHLLSDFAAYILRTFNTRSLTTEQLLNEVTPDIESGDAIELEAAVSNVLSELHNLDILIAD